MNHTILSGRPVADPETGTSESGTAYARFRLAHDRRNGAQGADREAMFINCVAFAGLAESIVGPYVRKGQKLTVAGRLEPDNYDGPGHQVPVVHARRRRRRAARPLAV